MVAYLERDDALDCTVTTTNDGTGLGLTIVQSIAEAHDWSIHLSESGAGGARFEFTGADRPVPV